MLTDNSAKLEIFIIYHQVLHYFTIIRKNVISLTKAETFLHEAQTEHFCKNKKICFVQLFQYGTFKKKQTLPNILKNNSCFSVNFSADSLEFGHRSCGQADFNVI